MELVHVNKVQERCRVCGRLLVAPRDKKARQSYQCTEFSADLHSVFGIDTHNDAVNIHPLKFCYRCKQVMDRSILAQCQHSHYTVSTISYEWKKHTAEECQVCDITYMSKQVNTCVPIFIFTQICNPRSPQAIHVNLTPTTGRPAKNSPHKIISAKTVLTVSPDTIKHEQPCYHRTIAMFYLLKYTVPTSGLSCRALVCTYCLVHWFMLFNCSEVKCPCCFMQPPIQPQQLKPAPPLAQTLLKDIMVKCERCKRDVKAGDFDTHECSTLPTKVEVKMASRVLKRLASTSPEQTLLCTGGKVN